MENFIYVDEIKIWTEISECKSSKYIILCSGGPGSCDYMLPVSRMIDDGYSVIRFEQRGCGRSEKDGKYDLHTTIKDMEAIRKFYGIESWTVGGHSWGANLSLAYAISHRDKTDAILYLAGNGMQNDREWSAQYHTNRDQYGEVMPSMLFEVNEEVKKQGNKSWSDFIQTPSLYKDISELTMRGLIMCASEDVRPNWPSMQIYTLMPNAELVFINGATHYIWLTHADEMKDKLRTFLGLTSLQIGVMPNGNKTKMSRL